MKHVTYNKRDESPEMHAPRSMFRDSRGQVVITAVVFFLLIATTVGTGVINPVLRQVSQANDFVRTRGSLFASQAVNEDALYRIKGNKKFTSPSTLSINSYVATATSTTVAGGLQIDSSGGAFNLVRNIQTHLTSGSGTSFNYGVQAGEGGLILENTSSVSGNVYSNGPILGSGSISSNPTNPNLVGSVNVGPTAYRMVQNGIYIYVVNESTIQTVNIVNPASPTVVSTVSTVLPAGGQQKDIALANGHIFVTATNGNDVVALSLSNPSTPAFVSRVTVTGASQIKTLGSYAYVLSNVGSHTLKTINISNPASMSVVNSVNTVSTFPVGMAIQGTHLYVVSQGGTSKLEIYSLTNPASPTLVSATNIGVNPITIAIFGSYAYIDVYGCGCIQVYNISNPAAPVLVSSTSGNSVNNGYSLYATGSYLYAAVNYSTNRQFQFWNTSNPSTLSLANSTNISGGAPISVIGGQAGYLYLLTQNLNATSPLYIYRVTGSGGNAIWGDVVSAGPSGSVSLINASSTIFARSIDNSIAGKDAYFKNISNTTVLGTSYPNSTDQATSSLPISDELISQWEAEALAGGVITTPCPYKITGSSVVTLGPVKINCDLEVSNSSTLYLAGMVWVKGDVTLSNTGTIAISPSISGKTAAIIADDPANRSSGSKINVSNSTTYLGSGANSYVMLLSQNNSAKNGGGTKAIEVQNSVSGKLLVYSPYGEILLQNSVSIKEVTAWRIRLKNSAQVIYETGLANLLFTSGPAGGYLFDKWREVQ